MYIVHTYIICMYVYIYIYICVYIYMANGLLKHQSCNAGVPPVPEMMQLELCIGKQNEIRIIKLSFQISYPIFNYKKHKSFLITMWILFCIPMFFSSLILVSMGCNSKTRALAPGTTPRMGWLRLVGSLKLQASFAEYGLFDRALLQKRPMILRSLLIVATPYETSTSPKSRASVDIVCILEPV